MGAYEQLKCCDKAIPLTVLYGGGYTEEQHDRRNREIFHLWFYKANAHKKTHGEQFY